MPLARLGAVELGAVATREDWIAGYDPEELESRGVSAEQAFDADEGRTLIETDKPTDGERRNAAAKALRAIPSKTRSETSRANGAKGGRPVIVERPEFVGAKAVAREAEGWGAWVWLGQPWQEPTTGVMQAQSLRRYYYKTRAEAGKADISDEIGKRGRIA